MQERTRSWAWLAVVVVAAIVRAEDRTWGVRGAFVSLKPGNTSVAIFQLPDKTRIEIPLAALSDGDREAIRAAVSRPAAGNAESVVTVRGPLGRSVTLAVPEILRNVETDAIWCHDAADAVIVYELYLAGDSLSDVERTAAEARLSQWRAMAAEGRVRLGSAWVAAAEAAAAGRKADEMLEHGMQLLKLGNGKLAEAEIEKASRLDPESGRAEFVLGLAYALTENNPTKALEHFIDASRRDPEDPWAVSNIAVCEFAIGRYGGMAARLRQILGAVPDTQLVADNLGIAIALGPNARPKMPDRVVGELNDLYRQVVQQLKLKPVENAGGGRLVYVSPYGHACGAVSLATLPAALEPPEQWVSAGRCASGVVIAEEWVLTARRVIGEHGEVWVEDPTHPARRLPATEVACLNDPEVALLKCEGLAVAPLPLGQRLPAAGAAAWAANKPGELLSAEPTEVREGEVVSAPKDDPRDAFVHSLVLSRGLGGGPIVDSRGRLVGLVARTPRTDSTGTKRGLGMPIEKIWPLLKEQVADLAPAKADDPPPEREAVRILVEAATVRVVAVEKRVRSKVN